MKYPRFFQIALSLALSTSFSAGALAATLVEDKLVTDSQGREFYQTGVDGVLRQLLVPKSQLPQPVSGPAPTTSQCPSAVITKATGPARVMLDEEGWITPVQDQGGRGSCDTFGATEALESAYLVEHYKMTSDEFTKTYGHPLLLSEQYMLTIKNEDGLADHDSGSALTNLRKLAPFCSAAPAYGLPLATTWPYIPSDTDVMQLMMPVVPGAPLDSTGFASFWADLGTTGAVSADPNPPKATQNPPLTLINFTPDPYGISLVLLKDLADYSWSNIAAPSGATATLPSLQSIYPPQAIHESAQWAPSKVVDVSLPRAQNLAACGNKPMSSFSTGGAPAECYEALAAPLEQLLSEKHAMAVAINVKVWKSSSMLGAYEYSNSGNLNPLDDDHVVLLVGYDRDKKLFRLKNSWGTQWADHGFFNATYDYLLRTIGDAVYVETVRDPAEGPVPNGIWRGFWQGKLAGVDGVAIIHHLYGTQGTEATTPAGSFYGKDGSQTDLNFLSWDLDQASGVYTAYFGNAASKPLFSLTMKEGSANPKAYLYSALGKSEGTWSKCAESADPYLELSPRSYLQAGLDPYVLPPCSETPPWRANPTWTCPKGGTYVDDIRYVYDSGNDNTIRNGCLKTSETRPTCPKGYELVPDVLETASGDSAATGTSPTVSPIRPQWQDVCAMAASPLGCDPSKTDPTKGGCPVPSCPKAKSVFGVAGAELTLGSAANGLWAVEGADRCVTEAYPAVAQCPAGYLVTPQGDDCLWFVPPPQPK